MRPVIALLFLVPALARAAEPPGASFDVWVNLADQRRVHLAFNVPDGTTHQMQVEGDLSLMARVWWPDVRTVNLTLISTAGGAVRNLTGIAKPTKRDGEVLHLAISVCGDRYISLAEPEPAPCRALPPLSKPDRVFPESCTYCTGPYEDMPATITSHERIAPPSEPGEPMTLTGRVIGPDGKPRAGVIIYAYHTDVWGLYPAPERVRSDASSFHGRLRGWSRSDADGRYTFDTIRPASYPNSTNPQHVHMHVIEPGCGTYAIDELMFTDDPMYQRLTEADRERIVQGIGGPAIATPRRKGKGWEVTRDVHLGEKVPGYEACAMVK